MRKYNHANDNQLNYGDNNSQNDNKMVGYIAIADIIMAATGVIFGKEPWIVATVAIVLCMVIFLLLKKWKKIMYVIIGLGIGIFITMFVVHSGWHISITFDNDLDSATDTEQSLISDIPIIGNMSFHNMHENYQDNTLDESEFQPVIQISKDSFMQCLRAATQGEIRGEYYQKYKGDKEQQMFAIVEEATEYEKTDEENFYGTVWYVDKYGAKEIDSEAKEYRWPYIFFLDDSNGNVYLAYKQYRPDGNIVYILGVNETGPYHPIISGQGSDLNINEYGEIEITTLEEANALGGNEIYYFCMDGLFKEYGGIEINLAELLNISEAKIKKSVSSLLEKECQINTIFYRENGIININFSKEFEAGEIRYFNITFRYDGEQAEIIHAKTGEEYGEGTYLEALVPSIATYPSEFPY